MIDFKLFAGSKPAPRFQPLPKIAHTVFTPEQIAEDCECENEIGLTPLGETINRGWCSGDIFSIYDPECKAIECNGDKEWQFLEANPGEHGDKEWQLLEANPGEHGYEDWRVEPDPNWRQRLEVATLWSHAPLLAQLLESKASFQFIAAPGTEREIRIRVKPTGAIQRFTPNYVGKSCFIETLFSLRVQEHGRHSAVHLMHRVKEPAVIRWTYENQPTGKESEGRRALLSHSDLQFAGDLFYALNALDAEALAAYGRVLGLCCVCGRGLRDAASIERGVGPDCWRAITTGADVLQGVLPQPQEVMA